MTIEQFLAQERRLHLGRIQEEHTKYINPIQFRTKNIIRGKNTKRMSVLGQLKVTVFFHNIYSSQQAPSVI